MNESRRGPESPEDWHPEPDDTVKIGRFERVLDKPRQWVNSIMAESKLKPDGRESTVGIYGGKIHEIEGKTVYDMTGFVSTVDRIGDGILRAGDDHIIKQPGKMLMRHPKALFKSIFVRGKRFRVKNSVKLDAFYKKFGLDEHYAG